MVKSMCDILYRVFDYFLDGRGDVVPLSGSDDI